MHASHARPDSAAVTCSSGVPKSSSSLARLLMRMCGCSSRAMRAHLDALPQLRRRQRPGDVVPEDVDLAVVGHQLAHAALREIEEAAAGGFVRGAQRAVGMVPVHQRVVEADLEIELAAGLDVLAHQIASRPALDGVVVGLLRVPQAEALVVLGGHHHVLHPGLLRQGRPLAGGAVFRLPRVGQLLVLRHRDALAVHHPLVAAQLRVQSPVDEHPEARFLPPADTLGPRRGGCVKIGLFVHCASEF